MEGFFWAVLRDDCSRTYEILGLTGDDAILTNIVRTMQRAGMDITVDALPYPDTAWKSIPERYTGAGFSEENGLLQRLGRTYEEKVRDNGIVIGPERGGN